jgi:hypothetical protein
MRLRRSLAAALAAALAATGTRPAAAESAPAAPPDALAALVAKIVPEDGPVRPPYELARQDMGLQPAPDEADKPGRTPETLRHMAVLRQERMERAWEAVKETAERWRDTAERRAAFALAAYAFGERPLEEASAAAREAGSPARLRLDRLLLAECRYDEAVRDLAALADGTDAAATHALGLLARHATERAALAGHVTLVPLATDLEADLRRRAADPAVAALIEGFRQATAVRMTSPNPAPREIVVETPVESILSDTASLFTNGTALDTESLKTACLQTVHTGLDLDLAGGSLVSSDRAILTLRSAYGGPVALRLYRFEDREAWEKADAASLPRLRPVRAWSCENRPLRSNNRETAPAAAVAVEDLSEGYYLVTAEARYAPVLAGRKFFVSCVALYVRAARNRVVVAAVDRHDGALRPGVPVAIDIRGTPRVDRLAHETAPGLRPAFRSGFLGMAIPAPHPDDTAGPAPAAEDGTPSKDLALARAYADGAALRRRYPDLVIRKEQVTGPDGCAELAVDIGRPDYGTTVSARRLASGLAETAVLYEEPATVDCVKAVAWTVQPVYRPGSTVQFRGVVRRFDGFRVADHDPAWKASVRVAFRNSETVLWEGDRPLTSAGAFHGEFTLPPGAPLGSYQVRVDGETASPHAPLRVEEFRLPTFQVRIQPDRTRFRGGETAAGLVHVRYVHGEPAADAEVEIVLETGETDPPTRLVSTDAQGQARYEFPLPKSPKNETLTFRASAMDASGESTTASSSLSVQADPFQLDATVTPSPAVRLSPVTLTVTARRWDGTPLAGAAIAIDGERTAATTDAEGRASFGLRAAREGRRQTFKVTAIAGTDAVQDTVDLALLEPLPEAAPPQPGDRAAVVAAEPAHRDHLDLRADASRIRAGEPIRLALEVDHATGKAGGVLLFVENARLLERRALTLTPGSHAIEIPTAADWAPSARVTAVAFIGRVPRSDSVELLIAPIDRFLTVEVATDRAEYRPRERCRADLRALDVRGRPAAGVEISLGVTHLALHALRNDPTPDLQEFYHAFRQPALPVGHFDMPVASSPPILFWKGPKYAWGCLVETLGVAGGGGGRYGGRFGGSRNLVTRGGGSGGELPTLRALFRTQAHWVADLVTDADGRARTEFEFPDDITEWTFTARGVTPDTRVGNVVVRRRTFLPLQVEVVLPRALRAGDDVTTRAVVHNNEGGERTVEVTATGTGPAAGPLRLAEGATGFLRFPLAPREPRDHVVAATVRDPARGEGDRLERTATVLPRGHRVVRTRAGTLREGGRFDVDAGGDAVPGSRVLTVSLEAGLAGPIASAIDSLIGYPYGCVEQTMSRFMPAVVAARAMQEARIAHPRAAELDGIFGTGLRRLAGYQHADGGWGWWAGDATNDFMTAYVLEGLALCRDAGRPVPAGMIDRAERHLAEKAVRGGLEGRAVGSIGEVDLRVFAVHALAVVYGAEPARFEAQRKRLAEVLPRLEADAPVRDAALLADTQRRLGLEAEARRSLATLSERLPAGGTRRDVFAASTLLELGAVLEPGAARWTGLAHRLVAGRRGSAWCDTLATAAAVRGLAAVLSGDADEPGPVEVLVDGRVVRTIEPRPNACVTGSIPLADAARRVEIRAAGPRTGGFWSARAETFLEKPPPAPAAPAARVACRVYRTQPARAELEPDAAGVLRVRRGETLEVELACDLARPMACVRASLPRPCGVELVAPPKLRNGLVAFEVRDDGLHAFADAWEAGLHVVRLRVRAEAAGRVFAPLPELEPMYGDPVAVAASGPVTWSVEEPPVKD